MIFFPLLVLLARHAGTRSAPTSSSAAAVRDSRLASVALGPLISALQRKISPLFRNVVGRKEGPRARNILSLSLGDSSPSEAVAGAAAAGVQSPPREPRKAASESRAFSPPFLSLFLGGGGDLLVNGIKH